MNPIRHLRRLAALASAMLALAAALILPVAAQATAATAMAYPHPAAAAHHRHPVAIARQATRKFHSLATAKKAGYARFTDINGIACIAMPPMGAMGVHYVNGNLVGTPALLLRHPEALVYAPARGHLRLAALEYIVLKSTWDNAHGITRPGRGCTGTGSTSPRRPTATGCRCSTRCTPGSGSTTRPACSPCGTPPSTARCRHPTGANGAAELAIGPVVPPGPATSGG